MTLRECPSCGGLPAGEAAGILDLCICEPERHCICVRCGRHWAFFGSDSGWCVYCLEKVKHFKDPDAAIAEGVRRSKKMADSTSAAD